MSHVPGRLRRLGGERGFTLVELMVASLVAAVGVAAVTTVLIGSRKLVTDSERDAAMTHVAEREMERALAIRYDRLALRAVPPTSTNPADPRRHVASGGPTGWTYRWDQSARGRSASPGPAGPAPGLTDSVDGALGTCTETGLAAVTPSCYSSTWTDGRLSGNVYRFVTVYDDGDADVAPSSGPVDPDLPSGGDGRRVTIVITVNGQDRRTPVVMNSVVFP